MPLFRIRTRSVNVYMVEARNMKKALALFNECEDSATYLVYTEEPEEDNVIDVINVREIKHPQLPLFGSEEVK